MSDIDLEEEGKLSTILAQTLFERNPALNGMIILMTGATENAQVMGYETVPDIEDVMITCLEKQQGGARTYWHERKDFEVVNG